MNHSGEIIQLKIGFFARATFQVFKARPPFDKNLPFIREDSETLEKYELNTKCYIFNICLENKNKKAVFSKMTLISYRGA